MRVFALISLLSVAAFANEYFCSYMTPLADGSAPMLTLGGQQYDWNNFNGLSFDSFYCPSGDVEGRVAVRNNADVSSWSAGFELQLGSLTGDDTPMPYSLVVGHNLNFNGGGVWNGEFVAGQGYVGAAFTGSDYLQYSLSVGLGSLDSQFDAAQAYFKSVSDALSGLTPNTQVSYSLVGGSLLTVTCNSATDKSYVVNIVDTDFASVTDWAFSGCNAKAQIVFNFVGSNDVTFQGNNQAYFGNDKTIYNIGGTGRTVYINTEVDGCILAAENTLSQKGYGVVKGLVVAGNVAQALQYNRVGCVKPTPSAAPNPCVGYEKTCAGLNGALSNNDVIYFTQFNVISFGEFNANTSDVEGRVAAAGNVNLGAGYSIGYALSTNLNTPDASQAYALISGGNVNWISGALFPTDEHILTNVGTNNLPADLAARTEQTMDDLATIFANAQGCYKGFSATMASQADTVSTTIQYSALAVTCNNASDTVYFMSITSSDLAQSTYTTTSNCNFQARWIINVRGTDDITFTGDSFPGIAGGITYNVIGNRNIYIHDTTLNGGLLAPEATLYQTSGLIVGKVVVANVKASWQINSMSTCTDDIDVPIYLQATQSSPAGARHVRVAGFTNVRAGDQSTAGQVVSVNQATGDVEFANALPAINQGDFVAQVKVSSLSARQPDPVTPNSASTAGVAFALLAIIALLF